MKVVCVIPARYDSSRFPGKPLVELCGKVMIQRVYEQIKKAKMIDKSYIATDDMRIAKCARSFGADVIMTSSCHECGTDRIMEAVQNIDCDIVLNVQGDEPLVDPQALDILIDTIVTDSKVYMATMVSPIEDEKDYNDPNVVKVVKDLNNYALYFSRAGIPFSRGGVISHVFKQAGIYIYRKDFLIRFASLGTTLYENIEKLEQLRALENGYKIKVVETSYSSVSVDTPEDADRVRNIICRMSK
ncbi:3-deoxy-manno-octulosonate cytidylyltransferase (CMP-KDO synthetase) [Methanolobus vulcani]|uniref:3-deoxy-manno-octulosonate cytidylyltransferase (CMP-KDO synthetase) n=1 Tax=Methanolobus vulcani TaxID=38026 RepID=A0A7Z7AYJ2_9EURY|nr:3-deoxy-manno-octulosonate cytidylyltransferase [Methanolobus vulcani]SDF58089.1 3-deoxy-manno-octulosonate cytidylyltransferase (CMP-KDO synthetase) [Methanolobus vulcani]